MSKRTYFFLCVRNCGTVSETLNPSEYIRLLSNQGWVCPSCITPKEKEEETTKKIKNGYLVIGATNEPNR